MEDIQG